MLKKDTTKSIWNLKKKMIYNLEKQHNKLRQTQHQNIKDCITREEGYHRDHQHYAASTPGTYQEKSCPQNHMYYADDMTKKVICGSLQQEIEKI